MSRYKESFTPNSCGDFTEIPAGKYPVKVVEASIGSWSDRNPDLRWSLSLEIQEGTYSGRRLWLNIGMSDKAIGFRRGALTALGVIWRDREVDLIDDVIGRTAIAETYIDEQYGTKVKRLRTGEQVSPGQTEIGKQEGPTESVVELNDDCPF